MTIEEVDERIDMKLGILMEHLDHKFEQLIETMGVMIEQRVRPIVQEELMEVKADTTTMKLAITETNRDLKGLTMKVGKVENRMERIERKL